MRGAILGVILCVALAGSASASCDGLEQVVTQLDSIESYAYVHGLGVTLVDFAKAMDSQRLDLGKTEKAARNLVEYAPEKMFSQERLSAVRAGISALKCEDKKDLVLELYLLARKMVMAIPRQESIYPSFRVVNEKLTELGKLHDEYVLQRETVEVKFNIILDPKAIEADSTATK